MADQDGVDVSSPATRLLDALGRGDLNALLLEFRPTTIIRTEDRTWSVQGEEDVLYWLEEAFERFPGLVFDSHARHVGYGQVIEEARVRDIGPLDPASGGLVRDGDDHQGDQPPLNMPVRLTVLHDDGYVHEIIASYPRALLRSALGLHVDPLDMAVSEIQSAFVAPAGSGFKTYQMGSGPQHETEYAQPVPVPVARIAEPEPEPEPESAPEPVPLAVDPDWSPPAYVPVVEEDEDRPRRRVLVAIPLVMVLVAAIAAGSWWLGRDQTPAQAEAKPGKGHSAGQNKGNDKPTSKPTSKPSSSSPRPTPTDTPPVVIKSNKPTIATLKSDLAFDKGSAVLSAAAKVAIADIADAVRKAGLEGTIAVHGYTDNVGSAKSGMELSRLRAQAVAHSLRTALGSYSIAISAFWHGEDDPIASNDTESGRKQNRRVTIILPKPPES